MSSIYLNSFHFPTEDEEWNFFMQIKRQCYDSFYPFQVLTKHHFRQIDFAPVTILYGGNGCGKSTVLNVVAQKLGVIRDSVFNKSNFYGDYLARCEYELNAALPADSRIITSDDVFDYMLNIRNLNEGIDLKRETLFEEYLDAKYSSFQLKSMDDYEQLKKVNLSRSKTQSQYVRRRLMDNVREYSNGESAYRYFTEKIQEPGFYILDEPENSLSPLKQQELVKYISDFARFFCGQFLISTHSPFVLALPGAKIYDMDEDPVDIKRWTQLESVQVYYKFFEKHRDEF